MGYSSSIHGYFTRIPLFWWLLVLLVGITLSITVRRMYVDKKISILQAYSIVVLCEYLFIVLISTVLSRTSGDEYLYILELFWSYRNFWEIGVIGVLFENVYNLFLLFPYGLLYNVISKKSKVLWIWISGTLISVMIEILQLVLKRGYFELDDIFHNSIGVVLGYSVYWIIMKVIEKRKS